MSDCGYHVDIVGDEFYLVRLVGEDPVPGLETGVHLLLDERGHEDVEVTYDF